MWVFFLKKIPTCKVFLKIFLKGIHIIYSCLVAWLAFETGYLYRTLAVLELFAIF